ncbi:hypothetical protein EYF80_055236 [Liparis tanakae]|uniref:Uncharacterized protein n=1 Tax=Liparis tanakae TaxID=230148 RepID=A0A4Z2F075_9TELE|nr:hypothetical protein EYF80_055236 [Liparis tanakae]
MALETPRHAPMSACAPSSWRHDTAGGFRATTGKLNFYESLPGPEKGYEVSWAPGRAWRRDHGTSWHFLHLWVFHLDMRLHLKPGHTAGTWQSVSSSSSSGQSCPPLDGSWMTRRFLDCFPITASSEDGSFSTRPPGEGDLVILILVILVPSGRSGKTSASRLAAGGGGRGALTEVVP